MANLKKWQLVISKPLILNPLISIFLIFTLFGCAKNVPYILHDRNTNAIAAVDHLTGRLVTTDAKPIDLAAANDLPVVLIFSQDTCIICGQEAAALRDSLKKQFSPTKIHLLTVLVGANPDDASDWKQSHRVFWDVAVDGRGELFKRYCSQLTVPCSIVQVPGKGIVFRHNGAVEFKDFLTLTGPWED